MSEVYAANENVFVSYSFVKTLRTSGLVLLNLLKFKMCFDELMVRFPLTEII